MRQTPLEELLNEVRLLYQSMVQLGEQVHAESRISMGMRGVLEYLARQGEATAPQMARDRRVSRQRIQTLVDALLEMRLVERRANPASRRSPLIALTAEGRSTIRKMRRREGQHMRTAVPDADLGAAAAVLRGVRESLEQSS
jgi:DNA-binding MarR family transcriptional regulator